MSYDTWKLASPEDYDGPWDRPNDDTGDDMSTDYKTAFGSYIKAEDLKDKSVNVNVEHVELEDVGKDGKKEMKLVAHFRGKDKTLILNRTNADTMAEVYGTNDFERWHGPIQLFPDTTMYGGKKVACVRLRAVKHDDTVPSSPAFKPASAFADPRPEPPPPTQAPIDADDIPFTWLVPLVLPAVGLLGYFAA